MASNQLMQATTLPPVRAASLGKFRAGGRASPDRKRWGASREIEMVSARGFGERHSGKRRSL